jgi:hypothetical protein
VKRPPPISCGSGGEAARRHGAAEAAVAVDGEGLVLRPVDHGDAGMAEVEQVAGSAAESAFIVDVEPGMRDLHVVGAPMHQEGHAQFGERRDALVIGRRRRQHQRIDALAGDEAAEHRHFVVGVDRGDDDIDVVLGHPLADAGEELGGVRAEMQ